MIHCRCGYTCGTPKAFDKHLAKFPEELQGDAESPSNGVPKHGRVTVETVSLCLNQGNADVSKKGKDSKQVKIGNEEVHSLVERKQTFNESAPPRRIERSMTNTPNTSNMQRVRLMLIRHGQSGNKEKSEGSAASKDPGLSQLGHDQAGKLGNRMGRDLRKACPGGVMVVSSPMRRCLFTALPTVRALNLPREDCICHGSAYEYGCAGTDHTGSLPSDVESEVPFSCVGFGPNGWDYQGNSPKENDLETVERIHRFRDWLMEVPVPALLERPVKERYLLLVMHQTVLDLLVQILVDGNADKWEYGSLKYKLRNTGVTELAVTGNMVSILSENDGSHLLL